MSITLEKLCRDTEAKYNLRLIAGKNGIENSVRWVHMVEDRQVPDFLHGNELVFTTGIGHISKDPLLEFVKRLKQHNASGVVINIGPYLSEVPKNVIDYCNAENFPLFTLPWQIYIIDITYDFCRRIIENEKLETTAVEAFKNIVLNPSESEKYFPFLERQGYGRSTAYKVFTMKFYQDGNNITDKFEQNNHIKLWNIIAKSKFYPSVMFVSNNRLIVIRQDIDDLLIQKLTNTMDIITAQKDISYTMGISTQRLGYMSISKLLYEADSACEIAKINNKTHEFYKNIGINKIIYGVKDHKILKSYVSDSLKEILDYDKEYKTDYAKILYQYLLCDGSIMSVADKYGFHRNTVNSKIKAIKSIFNIDLTGSKKMELLLAFTIKENIDKINEINGGNKNE